jgi:hypothetical protein
MRWTVGSRAPLAIERASPADLAKVEGVNDEMAKKNIYDFFHERAG